MSVSVHVYVHVYVHGLCVGYEHAAWSALTMAAVDTLVIATLGSAHLSAPDTVVDLHGTRCDT